VTKPFAVEYNRNDKGWIEFPSDQEYRKRMFPVEVNRHTAKANVFLVQSIIEYVSEPGQIIMDVMSGTGTIIVGALVGRKVVCVEISPQFASLIHKAIEHIDTIAPGSKEQITVINAPCQTVLPIPNFADHIIFSPPYASIMKSKGKDKLTTEKTDYDMAAYTFTSPLNIGLMNDFIWAQEMEKVYKKCYDTLKQDGTMTIITKDHMEKRLRVPLTQSAIDACVRVGFKLTDWFKWPAPGSVYSHIYKARGWETVSDEDIVMFRKTV